MEETARWIQATPHSTRQFDYIVTAGIRLLFFWYSHDDVGGGYIRMGTLAEGQGWMIQLLMGSDPSKAPRRINRWGAAVEVLRMDGQASMFFGFMKPSKGKSVSEMKGELDREAKGRQYRFNGIIERTEPLRALSATVPIASSVDFTIHNLPEAEKMVLENLQATPDPIKVLDGKEYQACGGTSGFLFSVMDLINGALAGEPIPAKRCYPYNGRRYWLTLNRLRPVEHKRVKVSRHQRRSPMQAEYRDLMEGEFRVVVDATRKTEKFKILFGTTGVLHSVPVQIRYQPNWWIRITLNLDPSSTGLRLEKAPRGSEE
jgi:hypothetical protein